MAHFAKVVDGVVVEVLVADQQFIDSGYVGNPAQWIKTSYNTRGGIYYTPGTNTPDPDQSKALRKNYAAVGGTYNPQLDAFIPQKIYPSWTLNTTSCLWEAPVPMPNDGSQYIWNEQTQQWEKISG